jgi:hypothetical protein
VGVAGVLGFVFLSQKRFLRANKTLVETSHPVSQSIE